jgi:hypothetical protein
MPDAGTSSKHQQSMENPGDVALVKHGETLSLYNNAYMAFKRHRKNIWYIPRFIKIPKKECPIIIFVIAVVWSNYPNNTQQYTTIHNNTQQ